MNNVGCCLCSGYIVTNCCDICTTNDSKLKSEPSTATRPPQLSSAFSIAQCETHQSLHFVTLPHSSSVPLSPITHQPMAVYHTGG